MPSDHELNPNQSEYEPIIQVACFGFVCRLQEDALLPPFKGSTLRGALGKALRDSSCVLRSRGCPPCPLDPVCAYASLLEVPPCPEEAQHRLWPSRPLPLVMRPPKETQEVWQAGDEFEFEVVLFGRAVDHLPQLVWGVQRMGEQGIGRRLGRNRPRFELIRVKQDGRVISDGAMRSIKRQPPRQIALNPRPEDPTHGRLRVDILTPLRMKHLDRYATSLPFELLAKAALRRAHVLSAFHGRKELKIDDEALLSKAAQVRTLHDGLRWFDWSRYSQRQGRRMKLGGLRGSIIYQGPIGEFLPYLRFAREAHLGKQTTFGLGELRFLVFASRSSPQGKEKVKELAVA